MQSNAERLGWSDCFIIFYCIVRIIAWELPKFLLTYPFVPQHRTASTRFIDSLQRFLVRVSNDLLNFRCLRFVSGSEDKTANAILCSPRYRRYKSDLYSRVARPNFKGYWILRNSLQAGGNPKDSDVTIFFTHGGGYISSRPAHYLLFLLRLAESILEQGISVSIFALDYSLAPEHNFPTQLEEASAAFKYLVVEEQVSAGKILFAGDSAGGHLAVSLLVYLSSREGPFPPSGDDGLRYKPAGLVLMSPWLSLLDWPKSFTTNAHRDVLSGRFLIRTAKQFLGRNRAGQSPYIEFLNPDPPIEWEDVLPDWVWVCTGEDEILRDQIISWVQMLEKCLPNASSSSRVVLEIGTGKVHVWQWLETVMDMATRNKFLGSELHDHTSFGATMDIGKVVALHVKSR